MKKLSPTLTLILSLLPGLPLLFLGKTGKAVGLLIIDTGIILTLVFSDSIIMRLLMVMIYGVTFLPACLESYQFAKYGRNTIDTDARWYLNLLLFTTGFNALPLLWRSHCFSKRGKILWTVAVPVLAITFFTVLIRYWRPIENYLNSFFTVIIPRIL